MSTTPLSMPISASAPENAPMPTLPFQLAFDTVTPGPAIACAACVGLAYALTSAFADGSTVPIDGL